MNSMSFNPFHLEDRSFLVTGAASGIGRAAAILLSRLGARLICCDVNEIGLREIAADLRGKGHSFKVFDLNNIQAIEPWLSDICVSSGRVHGLVHAAGVSCIFPVKVLSFDKIREVLLINAEAALALAKAFVNPKIYAGSNGSIVFVSSVMSLVGSAATVGYSLSKGAINGMTRSLAIEYAKKQIRVNAVAPGFVITPMFEKAREMWSKEQAAHVEALHPLGLGKPEDIANAIAFLLADTGRWITGTIMVIDGGYTAQ